MQVALSSDCFCPNIRLDADGGTKSIFNKNVASAVVELPSVYGLVIARLVFFKSVIISGIKMKACNVTVCCVFHEGVSRGTTTEVEPYSEIAICCILLEGVIRAIIKDETLSVAGCRVLLEDVIRGTSQGKAVEVATRCVILKYVVRGTIKQEAIPKVCDIAALDGNPSPPDENDTATMREISWTIDGVTVAIQGDVVRYNTYAIFVNGGYGYIQCQLSTLSNGNCTGQLS